MLTGKSDDEREDVPRDPADHERAEDDGDGAQSFAGPVVVSCQLLQSLSLRISHQTQHNSHLLPLSQLRVAHQPLTEE